jgi:hypothetical protein
MKSALKSESGFSMIELMVSALLTTLTLSMATSAFHGMSQTGDGAALLSDINISLRSTLNLMTRDMLSAGRDIPVGGISIPSGNATPLNRPAPGATTQTFPSDWVVLPAVSPGDGLGPQIGSTATDIITVLVADPLFQRFTADVNEDGASAEVDVATPIDGAAGIQPGDLIMFEAAGFRALQMVTAQTQQQLEFAAGDAMNINQRSADDGTIMTLLPLAEDPLDSNLHMMQATRVLMISYYIDATRPDKPVLMRRINLGPERAIGIGVENLQVTFDLVDGETNPLNEPSPELPNQIRKANVFLTGRSYKEWERTQQYLRTSVSTQMSLRSLSFVDRYNIGQ